MKTSGVEQEVHEKNSKQKRINLLAQRKASFSVEGISGQRDIEARMILGQSRKHKMPSAVCDEYPLSKTVNQLVDRNPARRDFRRNEIFF